MTEHEDQPFLASLGLREASRRTWWAWNFLSWLLRLLKAEEIERATLI